MAFDRNEEMAAYDALPPAIRESIRFHPFNIQPTVIRSALVPNQVGTMRQMIRLMIEQMVRTGSKRWVSLWGRPSPHVAAGATAMVTEPIGEGDGQLRGRSVGVSLAAAQRRDQSPAPGARAVHHPASES